MRVLPEFLMLLLEEAMCRVWLSLGGKDYFLTKNGQTPRKYISYWLLFGFFIYSFNEKIQIGKAS
jgi:hypothetical protein